MSKFVVKLETILNGRSKYLNFAGQGQYRSALGIDPDLAETDSGVIPSGLIRPTAMAKFSSSAITDAPMWLLSNPKTENIYAYLHDGHVVSYNSSFASETAVATLSTAAGNGAEYYDNYLYFARNTDIARYGPLDGSPSMTTAYWTSTLAKTALTDV